MDLPGQKCSWKWISTILDLLLAQSLVTVSGFSFHLCMFKQEMVLLANGKSSLTWSSEVCNWTVRYTVLSGTQKHKDMIYLPVRGLSVAAALPTTKFIVLLYEGERTSEEKYKKALFLSQTYSTLNSSTVLLYFSHKREIRGEREDYIA